jgi:hypothetical protein
MSEDTDPSATIPWYQSKIIRRLALSIAIQVVSATHLSKYITSPDLVLLVDNLLEVAGIAYAGWAVHARVVHPVPPVALSQVKADIANNAVNPASVVTEPMEKS